MWQVPVVLREELRLLVSPDRLPLDTAELPPRAAVLTPRAAELPQRVAWLPPRASLPRPVPPLHLVPRELRPLLLQLPPLTIIAPRFEGDFKIEFVCYLDG